MSWNQQPGTIPGNDLQQKTKQSKCLSTDSVQSSSGVSSTGSLHLSIGSEFDPVSVSGMSEKICQTFLLTNIIRIGGNGTACRTFVIWYITTIEFCFKDHNTYDLSRVVSNLALLHGDLHQFKFHSNFWFLFLYILASKIQNSHNEFKFRRQMNSGWVNTLLHWNS